MRDPVKPLRAALYHRASTKDQDPALCRDELRAVARQRGCDIVLDIEEVGSGRRGDLPGLQQILDQALRGKLDVVLCWKLDRFGRSMVNLVNNVQALQHAGVRWVATSQGIEIGPQRDAVSNLVFNILAAAAEFESEVNSERTIRGMRKALAEGRHVGRPRTALLPDGAAVVALRSQRKTWGQVAELLGCERWQARRAAKRLGAASR